MVIILQRRVYASFFHERLGLDHSGCWLRRSPASVVSPPPVCPQVRLLVHLPGGRVPHVTTPVRRVCPPSSFTLVNIHLVYIAWAFLCVCVLLCVCAPCSAPEQLLR